MQIFLVCLEFAFGVLILIGAWNRLFGKRKHTAATHTKDGSSHA